MPLPQLALTLGDPAGIGPEVALKALANPTLSQRAEITLVGCRRLLLDTYSQLQSQGLTLAHPDQFAWLDVDCSAEQGTQIQIGQGNAASGQVSFQSLDCAIQATLAGQFQGIVTAPIAKVAWKLAGYDFPGQTEVLAQRAGVKQFGMLFIGRSPMTGWTLRTLLATTHIPLHQVPQALTPALMTDKLELLLQCLHQDFGLIRPCIAIAGLNPHSGEQGQLGTEEQAWLMPWLDTMRVRYPQARLLGPVPPDTLWVTAGQAWFKQAQASEIDAYLALYHDQGLIPVKLLAFDQAINTTIGLPFVRTSPDHGTAFDIAGKGMARPDSLQAAIQLAIELVQQRGEESPV
ncbi:4-hydroxythreonine-4-phosphate dehydrogenase PdxA [Synechocystis sp. LKSZ1]|uniref:4-hydroxythreonine-4-phosphate dehydrogenase PdxA n=1 Tax=Synechocystis sp. LKSZ1 TaxID=3144951 RepID=UPI00336BB42D